MKLAPGNRLRAAADTTQVIVVRAPDDDVDLRCGGHPMLELSSEPPAGLTVELAHSGGTQLGKRYVHEASGLELLCTKAGEGTLGVGAEQLALKDTKALPSSD